MKELCIPEAVAHRGYSSIAPENTFAAFQAAVDAGAMWIECDVRRTRDGIFVILHDASLGRTTSGTGYLRKASWEYVSTLDAGSWFSSSFSGERIPTLEQLFEQIPSAVSINLEIKPSSLRASVREEFVRSMLDVLSRWNRRDNVLISSFSIDVLRTIRSLDSTIQTGFLTHGNIRLKQALTVMSETGVSWFIHNIRTLRISVAQAVKNEGHTLAVFTVNSEKQADTAVRCAADFVITNYPSEMQRYLPGAVQRFRSDSTISATR